MKTLTELRNILRDAAAGGPSRACVEPILIRVRQVLEAHDLGERYPNLRLMCHWALHTFLRDAALIYDHLTEVSLTLNRAISGSGPPKSFAEFTRVAATALDLDGLRSEFHAFLKEAALSTQMADDPGYWYEFVCGLLGLVCEKPMGWPDRAPPTKKPAKKYFDQFALGSEMPLPSAVRTIEVFVQDGKFKLILNTNSRVKQVVTIASARPFSEYDAGLIPTTGWAQKWRVVDDVTGEVGGPSTGTGVRYLTPPALSKPSGAK